MRKKVLTVVAIIGGVIVLGLCIHFIIRADWNAVLEGIRNMHGG